MRYKEALSVAIGCFSSVFFFACSGGDTSPPVNACKHFDYASYMPMGMPTLAAEVGPLFATTCAASPACHMNGAHPPDLGPMADIPTLRANIVGKNSTEVPSMKYVVAGDPANSWLMRKVEDANPGCGLTCMPEVGFAASCSTQMPQLPPLLSANQQATIRDWIKNGAN